jgi:hypothetical protein
MLMKTTIGTLVDEGFRDFEVTHLDGWRKLRRQWSKLDKYKEANPRLAGLEYILHEEDGIFINFNNQHLVDDQLLAIVRHFVGYLGYFSGKEWGIRWESEETYISTQTDGYSVRTSDSLAAYWIEMSKYKEGAFVLIREDPVYPTKVDLSPYVEMHHPKI